MRRANYVLHRVAFAVLVVFFAITANFIIFRAAPGDVGNALRCRDCSLEFKQNQRREFGLDKSKLEQYGVYLKELAQGNLGNSFVSHQPVWDELKGPLGNTLPMLVLGTLFSVVLGVILGVVAAMRRGTMLEGATVSSALFFYSMPWQWLGLMLIMLFGGVLPISGISDPFIDFNDPSSWQRFIDRLEHMILPALTLGLVLAGQYVLIVRSSILQTLGEDYVLTARAKGLGSWSIATRYGLRNALLPIVSLIGLSVGYLLGGSILVEAVFSYPGIGLTAYDAVLSRDYPVLQGAFLLLTVSVVLVNLIADLVCFKLDPRIAQ